MRVHAALDLLIPGGAESLTDRVSAIIDDYGPAAIHEGERGSDAMWRVFFPSSEERDRAQVALHTALGGALDIAPVDVPDEDWAARSQADLTAIRVGRIIVAPPWDIPGTPAAGDIVVVIRPSTGFGTGHHETTRLCLGLLQECEVERRVVLDVGTGSGVLAIAAARLGAAQARGVDFDADAIAAARDNLALNREVAGRVVFEVGDLRETKQAADIVLANLTGGLLVQTAERVIGSCRPGGSLILSGFMTHEATGVLEAFAPSTALVTRRAEGEWEAVWLRRP